MGDPYNSSYITSIISPAFVTCYDSLDNIIKASYAKTYLSNSILLSSYRGITCLSVVDSYGCLVNLYKTSNTTYHQLTDNPNE